MKAIMIMFDSLNRRMLSCYGCQDIQTPNFDRLSQRTVTFDQCYIGSMPCMPARRELHTGRYNFFHRGWGPLEPFDDSMPEMLRKNGIYTHLVSDHQHYWEDGGATYHTRYSSWEANRGQEGDPWMGMVAEPEGLPQDPYSKMVRQRMTAMGLPNIKRNDAVNRMFLTQEEDMPQSRTFRGGLDFIARNHEEDNWFLQIETFDPHEPFFASERFKKMYPDPDGYDGPDFDWPDYKKADEPESQRNHCVNRYKALLSMCDYNLGLVLDAMDQYDLWKDTMLIVNTDHGFLLGEHEWWGKCTMPHYNEVAHIPFFLWNPKVGCAGQRRHSLVQTIDIAPTLLNWFGLEPTADMMGRDLTPVLVDDTRIRDYALFGTHGEFVNITDGRYIYMRCPDTSVRRYDYTLMPTKMRVRYPVEALKHQTLEKPFSFTKEVSVLKIPVGQSSTIRLDNFDTMLFDTLKDPGQKLPVEDLELELSMIHALQKLMAENDAPGDAFAAMCFSKEVPYTMEQLLEEKERAAHPVLAGFEEFTFSKDAFRQVKTMIQLLSGANGEQMKQGFKGMLQGMHVKEVTSSHIELFLNKLPLSDEQKKMAFKMILS